MTLASQPQPAGRPLWQRVAIIVAALCAAGAAVWLLWPKGPEDTARRTFVQEISIVQPPPPPPPEPEEVVKEEEIVEPVDEPQLRDEPPTETPSDDEPSPSSEAAGLDAPADVGSDNFRLAAGKGGGFFGSDGGGGGGWASFLESHVRRALQRDPRTRSAEGQLKVSIVVDPNGRFVEAKLRSTSGDRKLDAAIEQVLSNLPPLGRGRPADVAAMSVVSLNMKRGG